MINERLEADRPVADAIHSAERSYNELLERIGAVFSAIAHARQQL